MSNIDDNDPGIIEGSDNDDEIEVTAKEVFEKLLEAWLNEKLSPELLETRIELVECMLVQVKELENSLSSRDKNLSTALQKIELERVKFVIAGFLRERLRKHRTEVKRNLIANTCSKTVPTKKGTKTIFRKNPFVSPPEADFRSSLARIESNVIHVLEEETKLETSKLSEDERVFAKTFVDNMEKHFDRLALQQMPSNMQTLEQKKNVPRPNLDGYVFIKVNEKVDQVILDPEEDPVDLETGTQHIVRYKTIAPYVESGAISLI